MTARILLLGCDKDYYLAKTDHDSIAWPFPMPLRRRVT